MVDASRQLLVVIETIMKDLSQHGRWAEEEEEN